MIIKIIKPLKTGFSIFQIGSKWNIKTYIYNIDINLYMRVCFRCGYDFNKVYNFNKHLKKVNKCKIKYIKISRKKILNDYDNLYNKYYDKLVELKKNHIDDNIIKCIKCGKIFKHRSNCNVHMKKHCPIIKKENLMDEFLNTKYNLLKIEYEEKLEEKLEEERIKNIIIKESLENKIKDLETKLIPTQINNGHIGDNIGYNITNITINNFGEEKINMTAKDCEQIMSNEFNMIVKLIEYIHIIPPENRNAFIPSLKEKYAMILKDQKWDLVERKEFINNLIINKNIMLEKMLDEFGAEFTNVNPNRSRNVINYCKNDEDEYKKIKINANLLLFNNKDIIRDTFETKYNKKIHNR